MTPFLKPAFAPFSDFAPESWLITAIDSGKAKARDAVIVGGSSISTWRESYRIQLRSERALCFFAVFIKCDGDSS